MIAEKVTGRSYANTMGVGRGNFGAIRLLNYVVAIDASMYPSVAREFRTYVQEIGGINVSKLVLTHYHSDHVFGNQIFKDCQIISSRTMATEMRKVAAAHWTREKLEDTAKTRPDIYRELDINNLEITFPNRVFDDSVTLEDEGLKILVKKVGGHTAGSAYVYFPAERVLFAGDLIFAHTFPWGGDPTVDPDKWIDALREFSRLDIQKIVPGHGPVCDLSEVQVYLGFFEQMSKIVKKLIAEGRTREEVIGFDGYPEFYASETPERRRDTLAQWYQAYKAKLGR